jgi:hypothetical protein
MNGSSDTPDALDAVAAELFDLVGGQHDAADSQEANRRQRHHGQHGEAAFGRRDQALP